jgi:hypothetical protein
MRDLKAATETWFTAEHLQGSMIVATDMNPHSETLLKQEQYKISH